MAVPSVTVASFDAWAGDYDHSPLQPTLYLPVHRTRRWWATMARSYTDVEGEGVAWGAAGFVASVVLGVALRPVRESIDLESVVIIYVIIVALCAAVGGRLAGFFASLSAALAYNFFFTTV